MPIDYTAIMLDIQNKPKDFYTSHPFPSGESPSSQFEKAVEDISKQVFASYDQTNGLSKNYHVVEYLGAVRSQTLLSTSERAIKKLVSR